MTREVVDVMHGVDDVMDQVADLTGDVGDPSAMSATLYAAPVTPPAASGARRGRWRAPVSLPA